MGIAKDPKRREAQIAAIRAASLGRKFSKEFCRAISERMKLKWQDPSYRSLKSRQVAGINNPMFGRTFHKDNSGESNPNYKHGLSYAERLHRELDKGPCTKCGDPDGHLHHKDGNHHNNSKRNKGRLCNRCHSRYHANLRKRNERGQFLPDR